MASTSGTNQNPQPIIDLILADINGVIPNLSSLVASYRLLVGASEEIYRTPEVCHDVFERAVRRADNAGTLIDAFLELLYCKIAFSSEFLKISCAPVDLFRLLANRNTATDIPFHTAEQMVEMEALRRILEKCQHQNSCLPEYPVVCPKPPPVSSPIVPIPSPIAPAPAPINEGQITDILEVIATLLTKLESHARSTRKLPPEHVVVCPKLSSPPQVPEKSTDSQETKAVLPTKSQSPVESTRELPIESRVRRKHLRDVYDAPTKYTKR